MRITEAHVKLVAEHFSQNGRLLAFATVVIDDCLAIHDIKLIAHRGGIMVAMPSRKITEPCPECFGKNWIRVKFCNWCGANVRRKGEPLPDTVDSYLDVAHPITQEFRNYLAGVILRVYEEEKAKGDDACFFQERA